MDERPAPGVMPTGDPKRTPEYQAARAYLSRLRGQADRIAQLRRAALHALDAETSATAAPSASGIRGGSLHRRGESYAMLSAEVDEELQRLDQIRAEAVALISNIDSNPLAALLMARYVNDLPWCDVAAQLHYSETYVRMRLHTAALLAFGRVLASK